MEKSLINICLSLIELDPEAPENNTFIQAELNKLGGKVDSYVAMDNFSDSQIGMLKKEIDYLKDQINRYERIKESLRNRAQHALETLDVDELKSDLGHKLCYRESTQVEITNLEEIPDQFKKTTISIVPDKMAIKEAFKQGAVLGAKLVRKKNVQIK